MLFILGFFLDCEDFMFIECKVKCVYELVNIVICFLFKFFFILMRKKINLFFVFLLEKF